MKWLPFILLPLIPGCGKHTTYELYQGGQLRAKGELGVAHRLDPESGLPEVDPRLINAGVTLIEKGSDKAMDRAERFLRESKSQ